MHCADLVRSSLAEMTEAVEAFTTEITTAERNCIDEVCEGAFEAVSTIVRPRREVLQDKSLTLTFPPDLLLRPSEAYRRRHTDPLKT